MNSEDSNEEENKSDNEENKSYKEMNDLEN